MAINLPMNQGLILSRVIILRLDSFKVENIIKVMFS